MQSLTDYIKQCGSAREAGDNLGISRQLAEYWAKVRVPAEHVLHVEKITGLSRHKLRPDIYGRK